MIGLRRVVAVFTFSISSITVAGGISGNLYKNPNCGCCQTHADYLNQNGFDLKVVPTDNLAGMRAEHHVPQKLVGCHLIVIDGYEFEGHLPASSIQRFLKERPKNARGLSVPGMPPGSPGMSGEKQGPLEVYLITDAEEPTLYETH